MKSFKQIAHGTKCRLDRAVEVGLEGGEDFDAVTRTGQERGIREVH
jgi:hypothetical protein